MCTSLLVMLVTLVMVPAGVSPYGFRNCIQAPWDPGLFRCIQRFLSTVGAAVGDLPSTATSLNLSVNSLRQVPPDAFTHLPQLYTLDLTHNQLELLSPGAFRGLSALAHLDLAHNNVSVLATDVFTGLGNLSTLRLDHNPLQKVAPGAFWPLTALSMLWLRGGQLSALEPVAMAVGHLTHLDLLDLCGNMLSTLGPGLPPTLRVLHLCNNSLGALSGASPGVMPPGLRVLDLSYNNISDPAPLTCLHLHNLTHLHLAGNPLDVVQLLRTAGVSPHQVDVSGLQVGTGDLDYLCQQLTGPWLQRLRLQHMGLTAMPDRILAKCPLLGALDVSGNRLRHLGCVGRLLNEAQHAALGELVAEHNLLQRLPSCRTPVLHKLHNVSLRFNRILVAGAGAFDNAPALRQLRLDVNGLARLDREALRGLHDLRYLRLDNNLLTDLLPGSFADLHQLEVLNLRNNRVAVLFPGAFKGLDSLQTLDLGGNNLRHLAAMAFQGLPRLCRLYLDRNRLLEVSAAAFHPVQATLGVLDLRANALRYLSRHLRQLPPFRYLHNLYDLKLQAQQPYGMRVVPQRFFQGLSALRSLYLSQNSLSAIPADAFDDLAQLRYLTLADSSGGMGHLPAGIFKNLSQLRSLNLESAGLRSLGPEVFGNLTQLKELRLAKNELRALDVTLGTHLPTLRYLDLRKCPLSCSCANAWLPAWLVRGPVQVVYLYNYTCGEMGGASAYLHCFDTRVCYLDMGRYLFAGTAPAVLLLLLLPLLHHRGYWRLRYQLFLLRAWVRGHWRQEQRHYTYDTFVSYNSGDEQWVLEELVPELERGALRLCLHHRDFRPGRAIVDNIVDAVYNSRHTVCVVSRGYLRSEWCSLEIQMASYRLFDELRDVLVLIFLEDIPEAELSAFHRMRRVLLRRTHLRWPPEPPAQPLFWAKLRCALRGGEEEEERERGDREEGCPSASRTPGEVLPQESNFLPQNHLFLSGEGALRSRDDGSKEEEEKEARKRAGREGGCPDRTETPVDVPSQKSSFLPPNHRLFSWEYALCEDEGNQKEWEEEEEKAGEGEKGCGDRQQLL
ncbi:PREDICTED: toll-like receptor 13 [Pseudopodoces humilis]|uniref:toll-like receptor 13 n=1 Tax=Pseudopodoces humilis TaxID=181119 RepID=UPI000395AA87|nr:PREDICTED: toll-like receptor 13 [Pseudopodoces humilis]